MVQRLRGRQGQANAAEYVFLITLVLAALGGMTIYVKRAYQARIRDTGISMMSRVANVTYGHGINVLIEYEPYYALSDTNRVESEYDDVSVGDTYKRDYGKRQTSAGLSNQLPPEYAD